MGSPEVEVRAAEPRAAQVADWLRLTAELDIDPSDATLTRLAGGNSNLTYVLDVADNSWLVRRPPQRGLDKSAHSMAREWQVLRALANTPAPAVHPIGYCQDRSILGAEFLVMDYLPDSVSLTDTLPTAYGDTALTAIGFAMIDSLAAVHNVDWAAVGLADFGRPAGYLDRQVPRWESQYRRNQVRALPDFDLVARWLGDKQPRSSTTAIVHGDFHLDNCLFSRRRPELLAVIDWEMATIGDPMVDLGMAMALWSTRAVEPSAMPRIQAVSRLPGGPSRTELIERYANATGRDISHALWYQVFALWKLGSIVEAAWGQHLRGELRTDYTAALERDVPLLFSEAAMLAGIR